MGFEFKKISEGKCTFVAVKDGDNDATFLGCIKEALKGLYLDITVDVSSSPQSLGSVLPQLMKLQQVLSQHQKSVLVRGLSFKVPPDFIKRLRDLGITVEEGGISKPPTTDGPLIARSVIETLESKDSVPLPSAEEIETRFKELKTQLSEAISRKRYLELEKKTYHDRLVSLSKDPTSGDVSQSQINEIASLEAQLSALKIERADFNKRVEEAEKEKVAAEAELKKVTGEVQAQFTEKKKGFDKKVDDLMKVRDKFTADFKKKQDTRNQQLAQAAAKAKPPP